MADLVLFCFVMVALVYALAVIVTIVDVAFVELRRWWRGDPKDPRRRFPA